jgi:hypothetical protein
VTRVAAGLARGPLAEPGLQLDAVGSKLGAHVSLHQGRSLAFS